MAEKSATMNSHPSFGISMVRIEVVQKVAPAFKDGVLVLVLHQLVVNVVESDGFGIRRLAFVPPYSVFCSISFRCGGLSIERSQKPLTPESTLAVTHHDRQKQVEVKRSSRANPHEIRLFSALNRSHPLMDNLSPLTPPHLSSKPPSPSSSESLYPFRYSN